MKIAYISASSDYDLRYMKELSAFRKLGHEVLFIGINRGGIPEITQIQAKKSVLRLKGNPHGLKLLLYLPKIIFHFVSNLLAERCDILIAVNEEVSCIVAFYKLLTFGKIKLVCDIHDSFEQRVSRHCFRLLAKLICRFVYAVSDILIVTDSNRYGMMPKKYQSKTIILPNYPAYESWEPTGASMDSSPSGRVKILAAGSLHTDRGMKQLLSACKRCGDVEIWAAGPISDDYVQEIFVRDPTVTYYGILMPAQIMDLASKCDIIFSFYRPNSINNINASPNKIFDALMVGRPVLINREIKVSEFVENNGIGFLCDYEDIPGMAAIIKSLPSKRIHLKDVEASLKRLGRKNYSWEGVEGVLQDMLARLKSEHASSRKKEMM